MYILDANVISELMRPQASQFVVSWIDKQPIRDLYITAITESELRFGVATMPAGKRRDKLEDLMESILEGDFSSRVLPFDTHATREYADIAALCRSVGHAISGIDCQIGAIALSLDMTVVTRNVRDFANIGVRLIDPWEEG